MSFSLDDLWWGSYVPGTDSMFKGRNEGQYAGVDRGNFNLPGYDQRANHFDQLMRGNGSISAMQLKQANDAAVAQQRSMGASASPQNSALAHLQGMQNVGRIQQGLAQQQAQAGIAERNAAAQGSLANAQAQQQGGIAYEGNRAARAGAQMAAPTPGEQLLGAAMGGAQIAAMASGGVVTQPTRALIGEAGPEAVIPLAQLPSVMQALQQPQGVGARMAPSGERRMPLAPPPPPPPPLGQFGGKLILPGEQAKSPPTGGKREK